MHRRRRRLGASPTARRAPSPPRSRRRAAARSAQRSPPTTAAVRSAPVPATTRAVNVDAFISCSACRIIATSKMRASRSLGRSPCSIVEEVLRVAERGVRRDRLEALRGGGGGARSPSAACAISRVSRSDTRLPVDRALLGGAERERRDDRAQHVHRRALSSPTSSIAVDGRGGQLALRELRARTPRARPRRAARRAAGGRRSPRRSSARRGRRCRSRGT